ncbi:MAG: hypothetical protein ACHQ0I_00755 [Candidatus Lutacidiplasmatales archaeon]|nr:hypothetical protein [Thermoplasmata archaeon]
MSEYGSKDPTAHSPTADSLSVPFLVLAAVLIGVGLFGMALWLLTFQWPYFASVIPLVLGAYMLFTRGTGPDRA